MNKNQNSMHEQHDSRRKAGFRVRAGDGPFAVYHSAALRLSVKE